jgi:hypothetical protein
LKAFWVQGSGFRGLRGRALEFLLSYIEVGSLRFCPPCKKTTLNAEPLIQSIQNPGLCEFHYMIQTEKDMIQMKPTHEELKKRNCGR